MRLGEYGSGVDLTIVTDLVVDQDKNVYLAQPMESVVKVFDAGGRPLYTLGGRGEGPGEFQNPIRLGWLADTLWVFDQRLARTSLFGTDGEFLASFRSIVDLEHYPLIPSGPTAVLPERRLLVIPEYPLSSTTPLRGPLPVLRVSGNGSSMDTIHALSRDDSHLRIPFEMQGTEVAIVMAQPYADDELWEVSADGMREVLVDRGLASGDSRFRVIARDGVTSSLFFDRHMTYEPIPLRSQDVEEYVSDLIDRLSLQVPQSAVSARQLRSTVSRALHTPSHFPPIRSVFVDSNHRTWLAAAAPPGDSATVTYIVLGRDGDVERRVSGPASVRLVESSTDAVWGITKGSLDEAVVVRFRGVEY